MQQPVGEAGGGFQRVAEGVAEIEEGADAGLPLVGQHEPNLGGAGAGDRRGAGRAAIENLLPVRLKSIRPYFTSSA